MGSAKLLGQWWFGRFRAELTSEGRVALSDALNPPRRFVTIQGLSNLSGSDLALACFRAGMIGSTISSLPTPIDERPSSVEDPLFWQYPCRTEQFAFNAHRKKGVPGWDGRRLHLYLGLPWATWIDKIRKGLGASQTQDAVRMQLRMASIRLSGIREVLASIGVQLSVHTVCQHIYWRDFLCNWKEVGITDLWLSHCPDDHAGTAANINLHPWHLYAVNAEDRVLSEDLIPGRDPGDRKYLASFIGAHSNHYIDRTRLEIVNVLKGDGFFVDLTDEWHLEKVVYEGQITGYDKSYDEDFMRRVSRYNKVLSDSVFSLCPSGAGANTIRLWESLAVGAIPVLCGQLPKLPAIHHVEWEKIAIFWGTRDLRQLRSALDSVDLARRRKMMSMGMDAYARVKAQLCF